MSFGPKTKGVLYHYTSQNNLRCIVENHSLWISHVYYMNDANEIKYGAELFKVVVASVTLVIFVFDGQLVPPILVQ